MCFVVHGSSVCVREASGPKSSRLWPLQWESGAATASYATLPPACEHYPLQHLFIYLLKGPRANAGVRSSAAFFWGGCKLTRPRRFGCRLLEGGRREAERNRRLLEDLLVFYLYGDTFGVRGGGEGGGGSPNYSAIPPVPRMSLTEAEREQRELISAANA